MTPNAQKVIDRVKELDGKATEGPWLANQDEEDFPDEDACHYGVKTESLFPVCAIRPHCDPSPEVHPKKNAELIAYYRSATPKLAAALELAMEAFPRCVCNQNTYTDALAKIESMFEGG